ncbi:hypothetical protein BMS3Abin02_01305 [bacterium BMS3Abin02]|nr:hypothetical protein BMS3Abin02_01305 [bacterium BMS3Abin02]GBE21748.1 hypothetical protein BMS3Bbin01_01100 [bacterium BMS3Bbin01]HDL48614.1 hypothetical protein [Actinomycetota bacterium]HDL49182.1 hypothetical protein [Actinomycetota bacterium]
MQRVAYVLIGAGAVALIGWSVKGFFLASEIPVFVRAAVGAIGLGALILIGIVLNDRLSAARKDDFKEVRQ